ncbi:unnamed protein product [Caretta caretta]
MARLASPRSYTGKGNFLVLAGTLQESDRRSLCKEVLNEHSDVRSLTASRLTIFPRKDQKLTDRKEKFIGRSDMEAQELSKKICKIF